MLPLPAGREVSSGAGAPRYERHRPERTLLYQLIEEYYPALKAHLAAQDSPLPGYVEREWRPTSNAVVSSTVFCGCVAIPVMPSNCWRSAVSDGASAPVAVLGAWRRVPPCWWTRSFPSSRCANGC